MLSIIKNQAMEDMKMWNEMVLNNKAEYTKYKALGLGLGTTVVVVELAMEDAKRHFNQVIPDAVENYKIFGGSDDDAEKLYSDLERVANRMKANW